MKLKKTIIAKGAVQRTGTVVEHKLQVTHPGKFQISKIELYFQKKVVSLRE